MFAGPNGSGKSTLKSILPPSLLGIYLNPDEIEANTRARGFLAFEEYGVFTAEDEALAFFRGSSFLQLSGLSNAVARLGFAEGKLVFALGDMNAYFASVAADFLRRKLVEQRISFTFESVMSSPDKVAFLKEARRLGYRTYLYYIATDDPQVNLSRVRSRVKRGGHAVPEDKIISRYHRSLDLLMEAIRCTNRAYIFDNSIEERESTWLAEVTDGTALEMKSDWIPAWFKRAVLDKITPSPTQP
jgi:predicted ABC-type ATPase